MKLLEIGKINPRTIQAPNCWAVLQSSLTHFLCWAELGPPKINILKFPPTESQNMFVLEDRVFKEIIKLK
jgi:hypothetical protein